MAYAEGGYRRSLLITNGDADLCIRMRSPGLAHIGYLLTCPKTGARPGSVRASGSSLSHRLPVLVTWLSFGLRGPGAALGRERLKRGLRSSK